MARSRPLLALLMLALFSTVATAEKAEVGDYSSTIAIFKSSPQAARYFEHAYGFALFPVVGKAGFVLGAAHGKGQVYQGDRVTGQATLTHLSIGFQVGGQAFSEIIFFEDKRAYDEFTLGNFEFDAKASAVAITVGVQAQTGTTGSTAGASAGPATAKQFETTYHKGMATFIHVKGGLMYEASVGGQKFTFTPLP